MSSEIKKNCKTQWEGQKWFIHENGLALTEFFSFTTEVTGKMVSASVEGEMLDYTEEELEEILKDVEKFEELGESDIEGLMKTWKWIAIQKMSPLHHFKQHGGWPPTPQLRNSEQPTGPNRNLPDTAKPLDNLFWSSHQRFMLLLHNKQICMCVKRSQQKGKILFINISCAAAEI